MNFEELSGIWNSQNMELEASLKINRELVKNIGIASVKSGLRDIKWRAIIGIPVGVYFLIFLAKFIVTNFFDIKYVLPALVLLAVALFNLTLEIYRIVLYYTIDSKAAVIESQKKLTRLKQLEILDILSLYIIIPLFSGPSIIVFAKALLNLNLYAFNLTWLWYYTAGSVVIGAIVVFFLRKFPNKKLQESISFLNELRENDE